MGRVLQRFGGDVGISKNWATAHFLTFMVLAPVGVSFWCVTLRIQGSRSSGSQLVWHLGPLVLISLCSVSMGYAEKAMAPHSSIFAWRIPWTEKPGRLPSMGSHRVGHG